MIINNGRFSNLVIRGLGFSIIQPKLKLINDNQQNTVLNFLKKFTELGPITCCIFGQGNRFFFLNSVKLKIIMKMNR